MKTKNLILFLGILLLSFGCSNNDNSENGSDAAFIGHKWKLAGFVNGEDGTLKELEPKIDDSYWITFKKDSTLVSKSSTNDLTGSYEVNYSLSTISITSLGGTKINELFDGKLFIDGLLSVRHFVIKETSLRLYQDEKNYLLFNCVQK